MEEKYIDVKGIRARYLEAGSGEPLLLVHGGDFGGYGSANYWDMNIDGLAKSFHVLALDRLGFGFTDNPRSDEEYVIGSTVQHAYDFLKAMNIDSAHLIGHSRGGYVATRVALEHPEVAKTLVIINSSTLVIRYIPFYDEREKRAAHITDIKERYRYMIRENSFKTEHITEDFLDMIVKIVTLPKCQEAAAKMKARVTLFLDDLEARQKETREWIREGRLKIPVFIVWGYNDPSAKFDPLGLTTLNLILANTLRSEMHIINQAGHTCMREHPETFNTVVTNFIRSNS